MTLAGGALLRASLVRLSPLHKPIVTFIGQVFQMGFEAVEEASFARFHLRTKLFQVGGASLTHVLHPFLPSTTGLWLWWSGSVCDRRRGRRCGFRSRLGGIIAPDYGGDSHRDRTAEAESPQGDGLPASTGATCQRASR